MKPIEEGCLAILINASLTENIGKVIRVGKFEGKLKFRVENDFWQTFATSSEMRALNNLSGQRSSRIITSAFAREAHLMRIDDDEEIKLEKIYDCYSN